MIKYLKPEELETIYNSCQEERETTICVSAKESLMDIYTSDNTMLTKLKKILELNPNTVKCWEAGRSDLGVSGYFFTMPKKHLSLRMSSTKEISEEQRKATAERFKKMHEEGKLGRKSK